MSLARVKAVRGVDLAVVDLPAAREFFTSVWNLQEIASYSGVIYFRATGPIYSVLSLRAAPQTKLVRIVLETDGRSSTQKLYEQVTGYGQLTDGPPRSLETPGGGWGFGFRDPEGRNFAVINGANDHVDCGPQPDRPIKLSHVNLNCRNNDATFNFMTRALGFELSDHTRLFRFIRCNSDHHSLVIGFNDEATLNHIAFEMPDLDSVMRGIGRMRDNGYPVEWGPGRHGPGDNVFAYFCGPEELPLEYTAQMQQVDGSYPIRSPEDWNWPPGRVDQWGITAGPSARVKIAQKIFRFAEGGFRMDGRN